MCLCGCYDRIHNGAFESIVMAESGHFATITTARSTASEGAGDREAMNINKQFLLLYLIYIIYPEYLYLLYTMVM